MMGAELSSLMMSKEEKELTAYHEAGHALMAILQEESDPIHKATIIPRGQALGMVMRLPENDRVSITKAKLNADLIVAMGAVLRKSFIRAILIKSQRGLPATSSKPPIWPEKW